METKVCTKCKAEKCVEEFYKRGVRPLSRCKLCVRLARTTRYYSTTTYKHVLNLQKCSQQKRRIKLRSTVLDAYGGKCVCCGETIREFLSLDHVRGGGSKHRKMVGNWGVYYDALRRKFPEDYQLLCHNCNQAKGSYGVCPHQAVERLNHG